MFLLFFNLLEHAKLHFCWSSTSVLTWPDLTPQKSSGEDLMVDQAGLVGKAATCMDPADIRRLNLQAFESLKMYFQVGI